MISTILVGMAHSVAIIGGGPSGLVAAKEAKVCGLTPIIFEQGSTIGGLWRPEGGKTWDSMRINNSWNGCSFSDYDWTHRTEDFPNQRDVFQYLCSYAGHFHLSEHVRLNTKITKVERSGKQWRVEWICGEKSDSSLFDSVIVCSGIYSRAFIPQIPGQETFTGTTHHAQDYKNPHPFANRRVAVIGNAFSGCEIAAEIAKKADKVFHIYHRPAFIFSRYAREPATGKKRPIDLYFEKRASLPQLQQNLTRAQRYEQYNTKLQAFCQKQEQVSPDLILPKPLTSPPFVAISDAYLPAVQKGEIILKKSGIQRIEGNTLHLEDGSDISVDCILFCTGYRTELPFLSASLLEQIGYRSDDPLQPVLLYKSIFHPALPQMAFVGLGRVGINFGLMELQARWACMALNGIIPWPDEPTMQAGLQVEQQIRDLNPRPQFAKAYLRFCEELAQEIGVLPDFAQLQQDDPLLYEKLWNGPFTTASYRLVGFGKNPAPALQRIDELYQYTKEPLSNVEIDFPQMLDN